MNTYALMFNFQEDVNGNGFLARVSARGRALAAYEDDDRWWLYGVEPGAIAASGDSPGEACLAFEVSFRKALYDFAEDAETYESFEREVIRFFHERDSSEENRWDSCVFEPPETKPFRERFFDGLSALPLGPATVKVERLDETHRTFKPSENQPVEYYVPTNVA